MNFHQVSISSPLLLFPPFCRPSHHTNAALSSSLTTTLSFSLPIPANRPVSTTMVKVLCVDACGNYPCICDMFAIHHFFSKRIVEKNGVYLTCADIPREPVMYGPPNETVEVFNPLYNHQFWFKVLPDEIYDSAKRELERLVRQSPSPTADERIVVIILAHGNQSGKILFGTREFFPEEFLKPLESYSNTRITIISNACFSATVPWRNSILSLGTTSDVGNPSSVFDHCAADTLSYNHCRTPSDKCHGSIFITHVLKSAKPEATIKVHTLETRRLVFADVLGSAWRRTTYGELFQSSFNGK